MDFTDLLPANRREFGLLIVGCALTFGVTRIPGITVEPKELTECKTSLTICDTSLAAREVRVEGLLLQLEKEERAARERIQRCWDRQRAAVGLRSDASHLEGIDGGILLPDAETLWGEESPPGG